MDRFVVRVPTSAAAAAAAAAAVVDPEDMDADMLRAYLRQKRVDVIAGETLTSMRAKLAQLQYSEIVKPFPASQRVHNPVEQNTKEWFFMRRGMHKMRIGGSEIGVVLGLSRFAKPYSLWQKILSQQDEEWEKDEDMPEACVHGHTCEDIIAEMFEDKMGMKMRDGGYYRHPDESLGDFYGASPDRLLLSRGMREDGVPEGEVCALLEIKAPWRNMYTDVAPQYMAQMQYQMWVSGLRKCYYLAVKLRHDSPMEQGTGRGPRSTPPGETRVYLALVHYSEEYMKWAVPRLFYFTKCLVTRQEPPHDLYESEVTGLETPPIPTIELFNIQQGAWRARPNNILVKPARDTGGAAAAAASGAGAGADQATGSIFFYRAKQPYFEFTNFYRASIVSEDGRPWDTSEHFYQAHKFDDRDSQEMIRACKTPLAAYKAARAKKNIRDNWDSTKEYYMLEALRLKFTQHPKLLDTLRSTSGRHLVENSPTDAYWGVGADGSGKNRLGIMLMNLRDNILVGDKTYAYTYSEVSRDLFAAPETAALAHCVSSDFHMGAGIALQFKRRYGSVEVLQAQQTRVGEVAVLQTQEGQHIFYLVTKTRYTDKPTYDDLRHSLENMRAMLHANAISTLWMPRIGCGLDKLNWDTVKAMIQAVFSSTPIAVTIAMPET